MGAFATFLLTAASEILKAAGDLKAAKKVDEILADRPSLKAAESKAFKSALARLGRKPA
jgi:hypothetical protein